MKISMSMPALRQSAQHFADGYLQECLKSGEITGDRIRFTQDRLAMLQLRFALRRKITGLGDVIHWFALPIARWLRLRCFDKSTGKLKPGAPCARRQAATNSFSQKLWSKLRKFLHL
jgi:hypothetical protein